MNMQSVSEAYSKLFNQIRNLKKEYVTLSPGDYATALYNVISAKIVKLRGIAGSQPDILLSDLSILAVSPLAPPLVVPEPVVPVVPEPVVPVVPEPVVPVVPEPVVPVVPEPVVPVVQSS